MSAVYSLDKLPSLRFRNKIDSNLLTNGLNTNEDYRGQRELLWIVKSGSSMFPKNWENPYSDFERNSISSYTWKYIRHNLFGVYVSISMHISFKYCHNLKF
jgi:hypothetical protein